MFWILHPSFANLFSGENGCESHALSTNEQSKQVLQLKTIDEEKKTSLLSIFCPFTFLARCHMSTSVNERSVEMLYKSEK